MKRIEFLKDKKNLDRAEEVTLIKEGIEETYYDFKRLTLEERKNVISFLKDNFAITRNKPYLKANEICLEEETINGIGYQHKDNKILFEDKLCIDRNTSHYLTRKHDLDLHKPHSVFSTLFMVDSGIVKYKFFDLDESKYELPFLPTGSITNLGFGVGMFSGEESYRRDIYFLHPNVKKVYDFFEEEISPFYLQDGGQFYLFGIAYDIRTREKIKLKRYHHFKDPYFKGLLGRTKPEEP